MCSECDLCRDKLIRVHHREAANKSCACYREACILLFQAPVRTGVSEFDYVGFSIQLL